MDIWFHPTRTSPACHFRLGDIAPPRRGEINVRGYVFSTCGIWRRKGEFPKAKLVKYGKGDKVVAPDSEICPKCAAILKLNPVPLKPVEVKLSSFSASDRKPIEDMTAADSPPNFPDELEGVDLETDL